MKRRFGANALPVAVILSVYYFCGLRYFIALLCAAAVHEMGHIAAIVALGGKIKKLKLETGGFNINAAGICSRNSELAVLLAGSAAGLVFAVFCSNIVIPEFELLADDMTSVSLMLSVFNLLPALPLDGGRILQLAFNRKRTESLLTVSGILFGILAAVLGAYKAQPILAGGGVWLLIAQTGIVKNRRVL